MVELLIVVAILGILLAVALPSFNDWIQDAQVHTVAESIVQGLQATRAEAVRRNNVAQLSFPGTLGGVTERGGADWQILVNPANNSFPGATFNASGAETIRRHNATESGRNARIGVSLGTMASYTRTVNNIAIGANMPAQVQFNGLGRIVPDAGQYVWQIRVQHVSNPNARNRVIFISLDGQVLMCDPKISLAVNPQGCV